MIYYYYIKSPFTGLYIYYPHDNEDDYIRLSDTLKTEFKLKEVDKVEKIRGLDITVVVKSKNIEHSLELLKKLNFPIIDKRSN